LSGKTKLLYEEYFAALQLNAIYVISGYKYFAALQLILRGSGLLIYLEKWHLPEISPARHKYVG